MNDRMKTYMDKIQDVLSCSQQSYFIDTKTDCIAYAIAYSLMWIAEELHEMNERYQDGY
jgi:hypothetical protein